MTVMVADHEMIPGFDSLGSCSMPTKCHYLACYFLGERRLLAVYSPPEYDAAFQCSVFSFLVDAKSMRSRSHLYVTSAAGNF